MLPITSLPFLASSEVCFSSYSGVDDILPILSYMIIRSGLPMLVSECALMQEFIPERYALGIPIFELVSLCHAAMQWERKAFV